MAELAFALFDTAAAWDERGALARFRRALRCADQHVLDDLLESIAGHPDHPYLDDPCVESALLTVLLGEQKRLLGIQEGLSALLIGDG